MAPSKRETADEIARKYGLADLVRTRMLARRLYLNALARRASISYQDSLNVLDPEVSPLEMPFLSQRGYYLTIGGRNDFVASRRGLPGVETRLMLNRRLAELEAERLEAAERAEALTNHYLTRSKAKKAPLAEGQENNDRNKDGEKENGAVEVEEEEEEATGDDDSFTEELEAGYLDYIATPYDYDPAIRRLAKRLTQRRLYPYRFRPITIATRSTEKRL